MTWSGVSAILLKGAIYPPEGKDLEERWRHKDSVSTSFRCLESASSVLIEAFNDCHVYAQLGIAAAKWHSKNQHAAHCFW